VMEKKIDRKRNQCGNNAPVNDRDVDMRQFRFAK
jgi:hypothetical protein